MKKIIRSLNLRFFLTMLVGLFATTNMVLAQYTVTLNANKGIWPGSSSGEDKYLTINENDKFGILPTPTLNGYAFVGWYKVPGQENTRVTPDKVYTYSVYGEMLHAIWTKKRVTLVFMSFDGTSEVGRMDVSADGGTLADIPAATYYPKASGSASPANFYLNDDEYFAGYYTQTNGLGTRIYSGVKKTAILEGGEILAPISSASPFTQQGTVYLYAFKTHVKHTTHWDYTYTNGKDSWININQDDATARIQYGKLTFMNNAGETLKWIYFQADGVNNKTDMTEALSTHTTTYGRFHLQLADATHQETQNGTIVTGDDTAVTDGKAGYWNVYFTDEELSQFTRYNFEPIHTPAQGSTEETKAGKWSRSTDPVAHDTWFNFTGATGDNVSNLPWTVKLENLKVYPDYILVKPLYKASEVPVTWGEISQLTALDGVVCLEGTGTGVGDGSYRTYSGSYPVWKETSSDLYTYAVGMVGFEVNGQKVYLNKTNPGTFSEAFVSANSTHTDDTTPTDRRTSQWDNVNKVFPAIHYTISEDEIPVVHFVTDPDKYETRAVGTPIILFGTKNEQVENFGTKYQAIRPGFVFKGWSENPNTTEPDDDMGLTSTFTFSGAKTVYPVWEDNLAPVITPEKEIACEQNVNVIITDNLKVASVTVKIGTEVQTIEVTGLNTSIATLTLPVPTEAESVTYTIDASDGTLDAEQKTVTIYKKHNEGTLVAAKDPTNEEDGSFIPYYHCSNCGEYLQKEDDRLVELTPEQIKENIIPKGYVLIKTKEGSVKYTKRWYSNLNDAIDRVGNGDETGTYIKLTDNTVVTGNAFHTPSVLAELNLNGFGLVGEDGTAKDITGHADVTILLIDGNNIGNAADSDDRYYKDGKDLYSDLGGVLDYANYSTVTGSPVKYTRTFTKTQAAVWQGLFLPINADKIDGCDFGTTADVELNDDKTGGTLKIEKGVTALQPFTSYFIRANASAVKSIEIYSNEDVLYPCDDADESVTTGVKIGESNFYIAGALNENSNHKADANKAFWTITNAGFLNWVDASRGANAKQRPYRWVIFDKTPSGEINTAKPLFSTFSFVESDTTTAINGVEPTDKDANSPVYNMNGMRMSNNANLAPGLYIRGGKKFIVR